LQGVVLDVRGPRYQFVDFTEDGFNVSIFQKRRQFKVIAGKCHIVLSPGSAFVFGFAESTPLAAFEFTFPGVGKMGSRLQNLIRPLIQALFENSMGADVVPAGLVDGHRNCVDIVDAIEQF